MHFTRMDLASIGIMRGRDNGLPDYNTVRQYFNLPKREWNTINEIRYNLEPDYRNVGVLVFLRYPVQNFLIFYSAIVLQKKKHSITVLSIS